MNRVVHFEIPADDIERASAFYAGVFGWKIAQWGGGEYWMANTGEDGTPGIHGGLLKRRDPSQPVVNTIDVGNIDEMMTKVREAGGQIVVEKMPVPTVGWLCYFKDTEGNIHGLMQSDSAAA